MLNPPEAPTADGTIAKTPLSNLVVYANDRKLTGTFVFMNGSEEVAAMYLRDGFPTKLRSAVIELYLVDVMVEAGLLRDDQRDAARAEWEKSPRRMGEILREQRAADDAAIEIALRAQLEQKLERLFELPGETAFAFYEDWDGLEDYGGPSESVDPFPSLWRGIRQRPTWEHVDVAMRRVGNNALRIASTAELERFRFAGAEATAIDVLRQKPTRITDLLAAKVVGPTVAQLLVFCLVITKQVDLVAKTSSAHIPAARPADIAAAVAAQAAQAAAPASSPQIPAAPVSSPQIPAAPVSSPQIPPPPPPPSSPQIPSAPLSGQAFARVQLQAKTVQRGPGPIVEEVARSAADGRVSIPPPAPPSPPPPPPVPPAPASNPAIPVAQDSSAAKKPLSSEQNIVKQKILERAMTISTQNYFEMLGVPEDAPTEQIQKAFLAMAKVWHPDRLPPALVDVKDSCSRVFSHLTEANAVLTDPKKREDYMRLMKDGGATPEDQAKIQAVIEAATHYQKAEICFKRNDNAQAYELAKKAVSLDPEQVDYLVLVTWLEALRPEAAPRDKTLAKIAVLDDCILKKPKCERAYFYRGLLYKRIDDAARATRDFKMASELNPRNLDAVREVRLYNMRTGVKTEGSAPPKEGSTPPPKGAASEKIGGLIGKLFKK